MQLTFITGNANKARYVSEWLDRPIGHQKLAVDEVQSTNVREVSEHKARQAYGLLKSPVLVEDCSLVFHAIAPLPGPFVKWFVESAGLEETCRMLDGFRDRSATATINYCLFDSQKVYFFEGVMRGTIAQHPDGEGGFGFDKIFIDTDTGILRSKMDDETYKRTSYRYKGLAKLSEHLDQVNKGT